MQQSPALATTACETFKQCRVGTRLHILFPNLLHLSVRLAPPSPSAPAAVSALEVLAGRQLGCAEEQLLGLFVFPEDDVLFTSF